MFRIRKSASLSVIVIAITTVGVDLGTKRLDLRLNHPVLLLFSLSSRRRMDVVCWTTTNPATTAALIWLPDHLCHHHRVTTSSCLEKRRTNL